MLRAVSGERPDPLPFRPHVELLRAFLAQRMRIVERIQELIAAHQKAPPHLLAKAALSRQFEDCFFTSPAISREQASLRGRALEAHWADGFRPRDMPGIPNEMFDPADMMVRAFTMWQHTRWPGRNGRMRFAQTLFNLYVVRCITLLDMRLWDDGPGGAPARLALLQQVLDELWRGSPADQPVLVRDVRWLVPVAQSPTTDDLGAYFRVAERITQCLPPEARLEIHRASVVMAGGHLRSQLRHFNMQGTPLDDHGLLLNTRRSNALDCAMTIQALVPLLQAYGRAVGDGDAGARRQLAGALCQGISPDPELYVERLDLLAAYSVVEHLFVADDGAGRAALTPMGQRHARLVGEYVALLPGLVAALLEDLPRFAPVPGTYSPYGVIFGFSSNLIEHMTMKALQPEASIRYTLEDVFADAEPDAGRLAWVSGWRRLPHISAEVTRLYEYPQQFAEEIFGRIGAALQRAVRAAGQPARRTGQLLVASAAGGAAASSVPELQAEYLLSSDPRVVDAKRARHCEQPRLLLDRNEGEFLASYRTAGGWTAISKDVLTDVLGAGRDACITGLPPVAADTLRLLYPGLVRQAGG